MAGQSTLASLLIRIGADTSGAVAGMEKVSQSVQTFGRQAKSANLNTGKLQTGLLSLARQATHTNPAVAQLANVLGSFAVGSTMMIGVLGGLAAVGYAWRQLSEDAADFKKAIDASVSSLKDLAKEQAMGGTFAVRQDQANARARQELLVGKLQPFLLAAGRLEMSDFARKRLVDEQITPLIREWQEIQKGIDAGGIKNSETLQKLADDLKRDADAAMAFNDQLTKLNYKLQEIKKKSFIVDPGFRAMSLSRGTPSGVSPEVAGIFARQGLHVRTSVDPNNLLGPTGLHLPAMDQMERSAGRMFTAVGNFQSAVNGFGEGVKDAIHGILRPDGRAIGANLAAGGIDFLAGKVTDFVFGLKAAGEAAIAATKAIIADARVRSAAASGNSEYAAAIALSTQHTKELSEAIKVGASNSAIATLRAVQAEEVLALARQKETVAAEQAAEAARKLADEERLRYEEQLGREANQNETARTISSTLLGLTARHRGMTEQAGTPFYMTAEALELIMRQGEELNRLVMNGATEDQLAFARMVHAMELEAAETERQTGLMQEQIQAIHSQARAQEQLVESLRRVTDSLTQYGGGLKVGQFSPLSPRDQLEEARRQFDMLRALAMGGDVTAAQSLAGAGNTLLDKSRGFNASGAGFVSDFKAVQVAVADVRDRFMGRLTVEERILEQLQNQTANLERQLGDSRNRFEAEKAYWAEQLKKLQEQLDEQKKTSGHMKKFEDLGIPEWLRWANVVGGGGGGGAPPVFADIQAAAQATAHYTQNGFIQTVDKLDEVASEVRLLRTTMRLDLERAGA